MRKSIYGITGLLGTATLYMILSSTTPVVETVSAGAEDFQIRNDLVFNSFQSTPYGDLTTIFDGGTYQLTDEDYALFQSKSIATYGKPNPMFYFKYTPPAPEPTETPVVAPAAKAPTATRFHSKDSSTSSNKEADEGLGGIQILKSDYEEILGFNTDTYGAQELSAYEAVKGFLTRDISLPVDIDNFVKTSAFGERNDPITGEKAIHTGEDYSIPGIKGANVYSVSPGMVSYVEKSNSGYGNHIIVDHGEFKTLYAHLDNFSNVKVGDTIEAGTLIGTVGNTGRSTGPHLHFEFRIGDVAVNPEIFLSNLKIEKAD